LHPGQNGKHQHSVSWTTIIVHDTVTPHIVHALINNNLEIAKDVIKSSCSVFFFFFLQHRLIDAGDLYVPLKVRARFGVMVVAEAWSAQTVRV
jgi:hypothetical protein